MKTELKNRSKFRADGFTLIELSIVAVIFSMIGLTMVYIFRSNLITWRWGHKHMEFNQKIQLAMKQVFSDIKRINPIVVKDEVENLWFKGEKIGDLMPNLVEIIDTDQNPQNGGEEIVFYHTSYKNPSEKVQVRIFIEEGALLREATDMNGTKKRMIISNKVAELHFERNTEDIYEVRTSMIITDDRNPDMKENLSFAVHLDTNLVCVVMKSA